MKEHSFETMSAAEFRASSYRIQGKRLTTRPTSQRSYSKKSDPPKRTRCSGIVRVIVDQDDAVG